MSKHISYIINPVAGGFSKKRIPILIDELMKGTGFTHDISFSEGVGHAHTLAQGAVNEGANAVIAIGGDGTMNEVASALIGTDTALGIVPTGSGNGLVRHLAIPLSHRKAINGLLHYRPQPIDIGMMNDIPFFCAAGLAFDAQVAKRFNSSKFRGLPNYLLLSATELFTYKPKTYQVTYWEELDQAPVQIELPAFMLSVCNAAQIGNNAFLAPEAEVNDGYLDLVVIKPFGMERWIPLVYKLFTKRIEHNWEVYYKKVKKVVVNRVSEGLVQYDGESALLGTEITWEVNPNAIQILAEDLRISQRHTLAKAQVV
jgi:YegS/Rv2252/BmrU family lipid kinase